MKNQINQFYASSNNADQMEFEDLEFCYNSKPKYVLILESKTVPNAGTYNNLHIECILYNGITKDLLTTISNWQISEIQTKMDKFAKTTLSMKIKDLKGIIKTIEFNNFHTDQERLFVFFEALEKANNWKDYDTKHLAAEITIIEQQIIDLKQNLKIKVFDLKEEFKKIKYTLKSEIRRLKKVALNSEGTEIN